MSKKKLDPREVLDKLISRFSVVRRYSFIIFVVFVAALYGFVLYRINGLGNSQPSADAVSSQVKAAQIPHIDPSLIRQLQSLQDNSVSVQSLFNQARSNPFQ